LVPGIYDASVADSNITVNTEEAYQLLSRLAREEGMLVGPSSAAALVACIQVAQAMTEGLVVTIFCDDGMKYLSERFWAE
jgi:cysteine synthase B